MDQLLARSRAPAASVRRRLRAPTNHTARAQEKTVCSSRELPSLPWRSSRALPPAVEAVTGPRVPRPTIDDQPRMRSGAPSFLRRPALEFGNYDRREG